MQSTSKGRGLSFGFSGFSYYQKLWFILFVIISCLNIWNWYLKWYFSQSNNFYLISLLAANSNFSHSLTRFHLLFSTCFSRICVARFLARNLQCSSDTRRRPARGRLTMTAAAVAVEARPKGPTFCLPPRDPSVHCAGCCILFSSGRALIMQRRPGGAAGGRSKAKGYKAVAQKEILF